MKLEDLRRDFGRFIFNPDQAGQSPVLLLKKWLKEAEDRHIPEFNAMVISTVGVNGRPSSRVVLLKGIEAGGLSFYTNYESRKGHELAENPQASLLFFWKELERQVRVEGIVEKMSYEQSKKYFSSRPLDSQISALLSPQSRPIKDLESLKSEIAAYNQLHQKPACPMFWGGYQLKPDYFEFWQGGANRLHQRLTFEQKDNQWIKGQLAP